MEISVGSDVIFTKSEYTHKGTVIRIDNENVTVGKLSINTCDGFKELHPSLIYIGLLSEMDLVSELPDGFTMQSNQSVPHQCPVCYGTGKVPNGFYSRVGVTNWSSSSTIPETCRSCNGTGIVWSK